MEIVMEKSTSTKSAWAELEDFVLKREKQWQGGEERPEFASYEHELLEYATESALEIAGLKLIGTAKHKASILSFVLDKVQPHDLGTILDHEGIAIRTGHHCAMPVMDRFKVPATARASFAFYNTMQEVDVLITGIKNAVEVFT